MKNLIQKFEMEMLSKDEMKQLKGGVMTVTCDVCDSNGCVGSTTGYCPETSASNCNGRDAGSGYTYENCREVQQY